MTSFNGTMECTHDRVPYEARVKWDDEAELFHGEVSNMRDVITFQGRTVEELQAAFKASIQDYLNFCAETGDPPERPFSGRFLARVPPHVHRLIAKAAAKGGVSLNSWVALALERCAQMEVSGTDPTSRPDATTSRSLPTTTPKPGSRLSAAAGRSASRRTKH